MSDASRSLNRRRANSAAGRVGKGRLTPAAHFRPVSAMPGVPPHVLTVRAEGAIYSGYSNTLIGSGKVVRTLKQ